MADTKQLELLKSGVETWNRWRKQDEEVKIDLKEVNLAGINLYGADLHAADLSKTNLIRANLRGANLSEAKLKETDLRRAWLSNADLTGADLNEANLSEASLRGACLMGAYLILARLKKTNFSGAILRRAKLTGAVAIGANFVNTDLAGAELYETELRESIFRDANLSEADLKGANLARADLRGANFTGARLVNTNLVQTKVDKAMISKSKIYGVNVWDMDGDFKEQKELILTPDNMSIITVDNIKVAQFVYLILNNKEIRNVLNTLTSKTVLILGRFALPERKAILDALRNKLRDYGLLPIVFDFERPLDKDFTETIKTLAGMCYFVIADITNPKSSPLELQATIPDYQIPFVPIIQEGESPFAMMMDLQKKYDWVLDTITYRSSEQLIRVMKKGIIDRAVRKHDELRLIKAKIPTVISASQFEEDE